MNLLLCVSSQLYSADNASCCASSGLAARAPCAVSMPVLVLVCRWAVGHDDVAAHMEEDSGFVKIRYNSMRLTEMPDEIFEVTNIESIKEIEMMHNSIKYLPEKIARLASLETINLRDNKLAFLPESLMYLSQVRKFILSKNCFNKFPEQLLSMQNLELLDLSNNQILELPDGMGMLESVQELWMSCNKLSRLPDSIVHMRQLEVLKIDANEFAEFPEQLASMCALRKLFIGCNTICRVRRAVAYKLMNSDTLHYIEMSLGTMRRESVKGDAEDGSDDMLGYVDLIKVLGRKLVV